MATKFVNTLLDTLPLTSCLLVHEGDSLTYGKLATHPASNADDFTGSSNYPAVSLNLLKAQFPTVTFTPKNFGVDGQLLADMSGDAVTQIDSLYQPTYGANILVLWGGTNDGALGYATGGQIYERFSLYAQTRRMKGWKVIVLPILPRTAGINPGISNAQFEIERTLFNTKLAQNWTSIADGYVNINSQTYAMSDNIHLNDAGYQAIAAQVAPEIARLLLQKANLTSVSPLPIVSNPIILNLSGIGANNSTAIVDTSMYPKVVTVGGNAKISTAQSKYGGSSIFFDGTNSFVAIANNPDYNFLQNDFTIEAWIYPTASAGGGYPALFTRSATNGNTQLCWSVNIQPSNAGIGLNILDSAGNYASPNQVTSSGLTVPLNAWTHLAIVSYQGIRRIYLNGTLYGTATSNPTMETNPPVNAGVFYLGVQTGGNFYTGYMQMRVAKTALYTTPSFFPPNSLL